MRRKRLARRGWSEGCEGVPVRDRYEMTVLCPVHGRRQYLQVGRLAEAPRCMDPDRHRQSGRCDAYMSVLSRRLLPAGRRRITVDFWREGVCRVPAAVAGG